MYLRTVRVRVRVQLYTYSVQLYTALYNVYSCMCTKVFYLRTAVCKLLTLHSKRTLTTYLRIFIFIVHVRVRVQVSYVYFGSTKVLSYFRTKVLSYSSTKVLSKVQIVRKYVYNYCTLYVYTYTCTMCTSGNIHISVHVRVGPTYCILRKYESTKVLYLRR